MRLHEAGFAVWQIQVIAALITGEDYVASVICKRLWKPVWWLPARHAHMPPDAGIAAPTIDYKVVTLGLAADGFVDSRFQKVVLVAGTHRCAKIGGVLLA